MGTNSNNDIGIILCPFLSEFDTKMNLDIQSRKNTIIEIENTTPFLFARRNSSDIDLSAKTIALLV